VSRELVVIAGSMAQKAGYGGHDWVFLQYLFGFKQLGYEVLLIDRVDPEMHLTPEEGLAAVRAVLEPFDLQDAVAILGDDGRTVGLDRAQVLRRVGRSVLLLNITGFLDDAEILGVASNRVFFDIDPGFSQMWRELGQADVLSGHHRFLTVGANVGRPGCAIPTCGVDWVTTRQPVVLDRWPVTNGHGPFTTVGAWRGPFAPIEFQGKTYGLRVHELRRFAQLPQLTGVTFEAALDIHPNDHRDRDLLTKNAWRLLDPVITAGTPSAYQHFIQGSGAEFAAAKNMYVQARTGWFSDRSACYLASGKPVLVQDTGLASDYPVGRGLLTFSTLDEAVAGVEAIQSDYEQHSSSARDVAEDFFDSRKVLARLIDKLAA